MHVALHGGRCSRNPRTESINEKRDLEMDGEKITGIQKRELSSLTHTFGEKKELRRMEKKQI